MPAGLYSLVTILVCIVLAKLAGADYLAGIAKWVAHRQDTLSEMLHWVKPGTAHRTTYSRILGRVLQIAEFERVVRDFFAHPPNAGQRIQLTLDGKTLRGTIPAGQTRGVFAGRRLGDGASRGRRERIRNSCRRAGVKMPGFQGKIITGDALLAQRELSRPIVEAQGDYVWTVKANQPQPCQDLETLFAGDACTPGFSAATNDFRSAKTGDKAHAGAFIGAMEKLADQNLAELEPERWVEFLLYDHPPIGERLKRGVQFAATQDK